MNFISCYLELFVALGGKTLYFLAIINVGRIVVYFFRLRETKVAGKNM